MKILTVVGARPQFIKAAPVSAALRGAGHDEYLVHTGQHYDHRMSEIFFDEMKLSAPHENLGVGSGSHGEQTGRMLPLLEAAMLAQGPDVVLVYGDTNSTLAGALAACKLGIPIAHVEAGLRSFNRTMPEEHNRVLTDHCSSLLFCPTATAVANLRREGLSEGIFDVGDVMFDAVLKFSSLARERSGVLRELEIAERGYYLATIHRAYNTDEETRLGGLMSALNTLPLPVILPLHPRTRSRLPAGALSKGVGSLRVVEPVGYLDMLRLESSAAGILTDSGGVQKEAYFLGVPCFTLRPETEWVETVESGWNTLVGTDPAAIRAGVSSWVRPSAPQKSFFGDGAAASKIADVLSRLQD